jgi:two-component system sensor histidine kinase HydH
MKRLNITRRDLLNRHKRELELERSLHHAERLATIGTLVSGLAHEIGTSMGVIRGRAELMLCSEQTSERIRNGLEVIVSQIDHVSLIVRMLLGYARARETHRSACDIRQIVNNALSLIYTEAERRNVKVFASLGEQPLISECDAGQLQQVFVNLEMNALDAMTPIGGTLRISAIAESMKNSRGLQSCLRTRVQRSHFRTPPGCSPPFSPPRTRATARAWAWRSANRLSAITAAS